MSQSHIANPKSTLTIDSIKPPSMNLYKEINFFIKSAIDSLKPIADDTFCLKKVLSQINDYLSQHQDINEFNSEILTKNILAITNRCILIYLKLVRENKCSNKNSSSSSTNKK